MSQVNRTSHDVSFATVFQPVLSAIGRLAPMIRSGQDASGELDHVQVLLESLPLSSGDFGVACHRLLNVQRYLQAGERGAARWELNILGEQLRSRLEAEARPRQASRRT
jgi:hypothetical protein